MTKIASKIRNIFIKEESDNKEMDSMKQKAKKLMDYLEHCIDKKKEPELKKQKL